MNDFERLARFITIYGGKPQLNLKPLAAEYLRTGDTMSTTINIKLTQIEAGRVRAEAEGGGYGIFAERANAQDAAAQVVKAYVAANPLTQPEPFKVSDANFQITLPKVEGYQPAWQFTPASVEMLIRKRLHMGGKVSIEYEDSEGHVTTRTISPSEVKPSGVVVAYDHLREAVRTFRLDRVKAAREVKS